MHRLLIEYKHQHFKDDYMKRYISLILTLSLCLSFAACSAKVDKPADESAASTEVLTTSLPKPDLGYEEYSEYFTDENGRVVYTVKATLPKITGNIPEKITEYLNGVSYGIFEDACESAKSNIENAAAIMDAQNLQTPWIKVIDYDINLSDGQYLSFTVKLHNDILVIYCADIDINDMTLGS